MVVALWAASCHLAVNEWDCLVLDFWLDICPHHLHLWDHGWLSIIGGTVDAIRGTSTWADIQFEQLEISVRVSVRPRSGTTGEASAEPSEVVVEASSAAGPESSIYDPYSISIELEDQVLAASTSTELGALNLPFLTHLERQLRGGHPQWTPRSRLARAFRAGVAAYRRLNGILAEESSLATPYRNSIYLILRSPSLPSGGWTADYSIFISNCGGSGQQAFHGITVCHAFATRAEAEAYLVGSRRRWPSLLRWVAKLLSDERRSQALWIRSP